MNKNTKQARRAGWASMKDMQTKGNAVCSGYSIDTGFPCKTPPTKRKSRHEYKKGSQ
jgi:hypothetical protein